MATVEIYGLYCPNSGELRYIGKAACHKARLKSHLRGSKRLKTPVARWIASLTAAGSQPICEVIETVSIKNWQAVERDAIACARERGWKIYNIAAGGNEPQRRNDRLSYIKQMLGISRHMRRPSKLERVR